MKVQLLQQPVTGRAEQHGHKRASGGRFGLYLLKSKEFRAEVALQMISGLSIQLGSSNNIIAGFHCDCRWLVKLHVSIKTGNTEPNGIKKR